MGDYTGGLLEVIDGLMNNRGVKTVNVIPGGRKILPFLCFLINVDELWLYQYHERNYGSVMNEFFRSLGVMENEKWQFL
jgi:hypothetical protein